MKTSYLIAVTGADDKGLLAQCFARSEGEAQRAVEAAFIDFCGASPVSRCIDTGAAPGLWLEGSARYIESVIA